MTINGRHAHVYLVVFFGIIAICILLSSSYLSSGWWQDTLSNAAFILITALFTALIVDRIVSQQEEQRWMAAREVALERFRIAATGLVRGIAQHYGPDGPDNLSFTNRIQSYTELGHAGRRLYSNPEWVLYVRNEVIPNTEFLRQSLNASDVRLLIELIARTELKLQKGLILFSSLLSPRQLELILQMLDTFSIEVPLLEKRCIGLENGVVVNSLPPDLKIMLTLGVALIEDINRTVQ